MSGALKGWPGSATKVCSLLLFATFTFIFFEGNFLKIDSFALHRDESGRNFCDPARPTKIKFVRLLINCFRGLLTVFFMTVFCYFCGVSNGYLTLSI